MAETSPEHKQLCIDILCAATASSDKGIKRICDAIKQDNPDFPATRTIRTWIDESEGTKAQYARAKEQQADYIFDQIIDIADDDSGDELFAGGDDDAKRVLNSEFVQRSKVKIDARKWVVSKLLPKKYGDKITHSGDAENPLEIKADIVLRPQITREEWLALHGGE